MESQVTFAACDLDEEPNPCYLLLQMGYGIRAGLSPAQVAKLVTPHLNQVDQEWLKSRLLLIATNWVTAGIMAPASDTKLADWETPMAWGHMIKWHT